MRPGYPLSILEFQRQFPDDEACWRYLAASRWPDGFRCERCAGEVGIELAARRLWRCSSCRYEASVTAGTVLHKTRLPLTLWFWAAYLVSTHGPGVSAVQLQRQLGINRYDTAWTMLHKFRRAIVNPLREPLAGQVEVDEAFVGGRDKGRRGGRQADGTLALVVVAIEIRGERSGRLRMQVVDDASADSLCGFVKDAVAPGSVVYTDGWRGYRPLTKRGYNHRPTTQGESDELLLPRAHRAISNLKTWILGTHHGVSREHLPSYLDEYVFRHNRRGRPMAGFRTLLGLATHHEPTTRRDIISTTTGSAAGS